MEYKRKKTWKLIWTGSHRRGGFVNSGLHNSFEHFRMMKWNSWAMLSYNNPWGWKGVMPIWRQIWNLVVCASISSHPLCMTSFPRMYCVASSGRDVGKPVDRAEDSWPSLPQPTQTLKTQCPHWADAFNLRKPTVQQPFTSCRLICKPAQSDLQCFGLLRLSTETVSGISLVVGGDKRFQRNSR